MNVLDESSAGLTHRYLDDESVSLFPTPVEGDQDTAILDSVEMIMEGWAGAM